MKQIKEIISKIVIPVKTGIHSFLSSLRRQGSHGFRVKPGMTVVGILGVIIAIIGIVYFTSLTKGASAAWFDDSYKYRKKVTISNAGTAQTEFQVSFTLDTATSIAASKMQGDCDDIRITAENGQLIPYWIEEGSAPCDNASTKIWVKIPSIPVSDTNIYVYYGNPSVTAGADGSKVFPFFDNFNGGSLDTAKWGATGAYSIASGELTITTGALYTNNPILSTAQGYIYESRRKWQAFPASTSYSGLEIAEVQTTTSGNSGAHALTYYMSQGDTSGTIPAWAANGSAASYNIVGNVTQYTATATTYYINSFAMDGTNIIYYNNRTQTNSYVGNWTEAPYLFLGLFLGAGSGTTDVHDMVTDWVLARKYAATAPSAGSPGSEETTPGPVAYWKFNEGQGSTAYDSTQSANNGTLGSGTSAPTWQTENMCVSGKCLWFDGSNDYVSIGTTVPSIKSVSFWVRPNTTTEYFIDINGTANIQSSGGIVSGTGFTSPTIYVDGRESTTITANTWHQITVTTSTALTGSGMTIGKISTNFLQGFMDEVKIYPYVRSAAEIKQDYASRGSVHGVSAQFGDPDMSGRKLSSGLLGYYKMDEATGSTGPSWTVLDSSGNGYDKVGVGNAGTTAPGKFGNAGTFDGTGDYVSPASVAGTISFANLGSSSAPDFQSSTDTTSYTSPSWTPPTEGLIVSFIWGGRSGGGADVPTVSGNSITWTVIKSLDWSSGSTGRTLHLVGANASGATSGVTTINWGANTQIGTVVSFFQATGVDLSGGVPAAFIQSGTANGTATSGSITLNAAASSGNRPIAGFGHAANEGKSERTNWTELDDLGGVGPTRNLETQYRSDAFETTASGTWPTSAIWGGIAAELQVETTSASEIDNVDTFTLSSWVNPSSSIASKALMVRNNEIRLVTDASGNPVCQIHNGTDWQTAATSSTALSLSSWQHVGCTYDQKTLRVFVNGVQTGSQALTETVANSSNNWHFGLDAGGTYGGYNGKMDDVRIYNRVFSPREVSQLYEWAPGPVGYYDMNENTGTSTVNDRSGNGYTGTMNGSMTESDWVPGKYSSALDFDGTDDYVSAGDISDLNAAANFTSSAWVYKAGNAAGAATNGAIAGKWNTGAAAGWFIDFNDSDHATEANQIRFFISGVSDTSLSSGSTVSSNAWHYITVKYDGVNKYIYVDGIQVASEATTGTPTSTTDPFQIGFDTTSGGGNNYFNGRIDDVKIYNYARTQKQIIADMNAGHPSVGSPVGSPVGYWKFDEGYGSTVNNSGNVGSTLNGNFGTGNSAPTWTNDGKFGKALSFDGSDDYVGLGDAASLNPTTQITMSVWVKMDDAGTDLSQNQYFISKSTSNQTASTNSYNLLMVNSGGAGADTDYLYMLISDGTNIQGTGNYPGVSMDELSPSQWYHVVGVYDGSYLYLYLNGELKGKEATTLTGNIVDLATETRLGGRGDNTRQFDGTMDEVKIYNFALTADEVKSDYNRGKAIVLGAGSTGVGGTSASNAASREYCVPGDASACSAPVAEWKIDENTGTSVNDTSGNGNIGTLGIGNSAPTWGSGIKGSGLLFDGSNDYISVGSGNTAPLSFTDFTISAWINADSFAAGTRVVSTYHGSSPSNFYNISIASGNFPQLSFRNTGGTLVITIASDAIQTGKWYHVVGVRNAGSTAKIYVNGLGVGSTADGTGGVSIGPHEYVSIGWDPARSSGLSFDGKIDDVRIYDYARTQAQVAWEFNKGAPVAQYKFDECEGTTAYNSVKTNNGPAGNNGTISIGGSGTNDMAGTCTGDSSEAWFNGATGKRNASLDFDGTDDYVWMADNDIFSFTNVGTTDNPLSISAWVKMDDATSFPIIAKADATNAEYALSFDSNDKLSLGLYDNTFLGSTRLQIKADTASTSDEGSWIHFVATYNGNSDGTGLKLYRNGQLMASTTSEAGYTAMENETLKVVIGRSTDGGTGYANGKIDELKIFNYELTPAQIKTEYTGGAVRFE